MARYSTALIVVMALAIPSYGDETKADVELKRLAERTGKARDDEQLRQDIHAFRRMYPGTPQATRTAGLLRDLPSPLDKHDALNIPSLEKLAWQPKELVAIFGAHRGRQGGAVTSGVYRRNGKMLVSGSTNGYVRYWDPATMRLQHTLVQAGGPFA